MKLEVKTSCHGMPCIELENAGKRTHSILRRIVMNNWMDSDDYKISKAAGAFFQGGYDLKEGWILIEFWNSKGVGAFVEYTNNQLK